ncbi:MAG: hypothetical protein PVJ33_05950 [Lysobacterales bacterium]
MGVRHVHLHIDRLVLHGFRPEDRHGVAAGMQQELIRTLSDPRIAKSLMAKDGVLRLRFGGLHISEGSRPLYVGMQVARTIGKEIRK